MNGRRRPADEDSARTSAADPLLEAALAAADGRAPAAVASGSVDSNVLHKLGRLAALKTAFAAQDPPPGHEPSDQDTSLPGEWAHLRVLGRLGSGSFGEVLRAFDPVLQREVALKLRRADCGGGDADYIEEARRLARVRHPHVLAVHGADVARGRVGMWADLIEGRTLEQELAASGPFPAASVRALAAQLAAALAAIHEAGLVHGDVKPDNVMIDGTRAVLMDFGAGTASGVAPRFGSPLSMAPELLGGGTASDRSDIYSLGALLYRLALGSHHRRDQVSGGAPPAADAPAPEFPRGARSALRRALGKPTAQLLEAMLSASPAQRPSAIEAIAALHEIERLPRRRARRAATATVVLALCIGLVASLLALQRVRSERDRSERIKDFMIDGLQQTSPMRASGPASVLDMLGHMAASVDERLAGLDDARAEMRVVIGESFNMFGETGRGIALLEEGIAQLRAAPRAEPRDLGNALITLAALLRKRGDAEGALRAADEADAIFRRLPDSEATRHARIKIGALLGNLHNGAGRPLAAMDAHRRTLAARQALFGPDDPRLAVDYNNIGAAALRAGLPADAAEAYSGAARLLEADGKGDSGPMAMVQLGLAKALSLLPGRHDDSDAHGRLAAGLYATNYPNGHPHRWTVEEAAARNLLLRGDAAAAAERYTALLRSAPHAPPATAHFYAAAALLGAGRSAAAARQFALAGAVAEPDDPLSIVAPAAAAYARWHGGTGDDPRDALASALQLLRASEYAARHEGELLQQWLQALPPQRQSPH